VDATGLAGNYQNSSSDEFGDYASRLPEEGAIFPARRLTDALKAADPQLLFRLRL
jgi:hypothetical protein